MALYQIKQFHPLPNFFHLFMLDLWIKDGTRKKYSDYLCFTFIEHIDHRDIIIGTGNIIIF